MEKIGEDEDSIFYTADFEGHQIGLMMDKRTKEILLNADDLIKLCGLGEAFTDFLGTDKGIEFLNYMKNN
jgi:hypothetical protein